VDHDRDRRSDRRLRRSWHPGVSGNRRSGPPPAAMNSKNI
jgi:hypothetical protein